MNFKALPTRNHWLFNLVFLIVFSLANTFAYAENQSQLSKKALEAWEQAQDYSLAHPIIAFAVYGRTTDATAHENAEKIIRYFEKHNIMSKYFLADENDMGSSVGFYIQGIQYGPKPLSKALPLIQQVMAHYKQEYSNGP